MLSKITLLLTAGLVVVAATVGWPAATCLATSASSEMACKPGCCAEKTCCETSPERTEPLAQPLVRTGPGQGNVMALPAIAVVRLFMPAPAESRVFSSSAGRAHSLPPLELICIRLI